jgi:5-methylcytosine-specific restriction endonuclease McrA
MEAAARPPNLESLTVFPFPCPNCDKQIAKAALFCSDLCSYEAASVRYFRRCIKDGRFEQPDVQEALQIRFALILGGGYSRTDRQLSDSIRQEVISRDQGRCQKCGADGDAIDHIQGSSNDLLNLQLLCFKCHNEKTKAGFTPISPQSHPVQWAKREILISRVRSIDPIRICDHPGWDKLWQSVLKTRRQVLKRKNTKKN